MHIPTAPTATIEIEPFYEALKRADTPRPDYDISRWLYVPPVYTEYRYILGTRGANPLICVGINPSTAAPDDLDNTLKSVERISKFNGYDSFIMFNVYPQRATNPDDMESEINDALSRENMLAFEYALSVSRSPSVWAAWGTIVEKRDYLTRCVENMIAIGKKYGAEWYSSGKLSKAGHPHHPLYLKKDSPLDPFDIEGYLNVIR